MKGGGRESGPTGDTKPSRADTRQAAANPACPYHCGEDRQTVPTAHAGWLHERIRELDAELAEWKACSLAEWCAVRTITEEAAALKAELAAATNRGQAARARERALKAVRARTRGAAAQWRYLNDSKRVERPP